MTLLFLLFVSLSCDDTVSQRYLPSDYVSSTSRGKSHGTLYRRNCIVLQDAPDSASQSDTNASRYSIDIRTHTRISSRNSAVHFCYLLFYGRKSLPHADSWCTEGRRAIAKGGSVKTSRVRLPRMPSTTKQGWGTYIRTLLIRLYPARIQFPR